MSRPLRAMALLALLSTAAVGCPQPFGAVAPLDDGAPREDDAAAPLPLADAAGGGGDAGAADAGLDAAGLGACPVVVEERFDLLALSGWEVSMSAGPLATSTSVPSAPSPPNALQIEAESPGSTHLSRPLRGASTTTASCFGLRLSVRVLLATERFRFAWLQSSTSNKTVSLELGRGMVFAVLDDGSSVSAPVPSETDWWTVALAVEVAPDGARAVLTAGGASLQRIVLPDAFGREALTAFVGAAVYPSALGRAQILVDDVVLTSGAR